MSSSIVPLNSSDCNSYVFKFGEFEVRVTLDKEGNPWFIAGDACKALGYANSSQAVSDNVDEDDKAYLLEGRDIVTLPTRYSPKTPLVINESGLYALILSSRKPDAKPFKKWVTSEVLPAIRKTGGYAVTQMTPAEIILMQAQKLVDLERQQKRLEAQAVELYEKQGQMAADLEDVKAELHNADWQTITVYCGKQGIRSTLALRQLWGKQAAALSRERGIEIRKVEVRTRWSVENAYHTSVLADVCGKAPKRTDQPLLLDGK